MANEAAAGGERGGGGTQRRYVSISIEQRIIRTEADPQKNLSCPPQWLHTHKHTHTQLVENLGNKKKDEDEVKVAARQNEKKAHTGNNFEEQRAKQQKGTKKTNKK